MATAPIGWGETDQQAQQIQRQRALAERLLQRQETPLQGQTVGGHYIAPAWTEQLARALSGYVGDKMNDKADARMAEVSDRRRNIMSDALRNFGTDMAGTPAKPGFDVPANEMDQEGYGMKPVAATAGNPMKAYAGLMDSGIPELQTMGMQGTMTTAKDQATMARQQQLAQLLGTMPDAQSAIKAGIPAEMVKSYFEAPLLGKEDLLSVNGQLVGKKTGAAVGQAIPKQAEPYTLAPGATRYGADNKPIASVTDYNKPFKPDGTPNVGFQTFAMSKAKASAAQGPTVNVNTATKPFLNELGKGAGEQVNADFAGARSAAQSLQNIQQIEKGLGNAILGPGANVRVKLGQIGELLGVNGKDATEQLQNTRNVLQGLARQELAAAGQMKGQGQITESERAILRKAEAGEISEMTTPEVRTLLTAIKKTASYRIGIHQQNVKRLEKDPNAAGIVDYMRVDAPDSVPAPQGGGFKILGVQ